MDPLLLDIINYLVDAGVLEGDGIDAFRDFIPEEPSELVAFIEYTGTPTLMVDPAVHRSVQVSTRNIDADLARQKCLAIYTALENGRSEDGRIDFTDNRFGQVYFRQTPFRYKTDENNRAYYCFNLGITTSIN